MMMIPVLLGLSLWVRTVTAIPLAWVLMLTAGGIHSELPNWTWVRPISFWLALGFSYVLMTLLPSWVNLPNSGSRSDSDDSDKDQYAR